MKRRVLTAERVVEVLGGPVEVCRITGANPKQAWHWHGRAKAFPAWTYAAMQLALEQRGYEAPARLWGMKGRLKAA